MEIRSAGGERGTIAGASPNALSSGLRSVSAFSKCLSPRRGPSHSNFVYSIVAQMWGKTHGLQPFAERSCREQGKLKAGMVATYPRLQVDLRPSAGGLGRSVRRESGHGPWLEARPPASPLASQAPVPEPRRRAAPGTVPALGRDAGGPGIRSSECARIDEVKRGAGSDG